jgi:hypothetical protein
LKKFYRKNHVNYRNFNPIWVQLTSIHVKSIGTQVKKDTLIVKVEGISQVGADRNNFDSAPLEVTTDNSVKVAVGTHLVNPALDQTLGQSLHDEQLHLLHRQGRLLNSQHILLTNKTGFSL